MSKIKSLLALSALLFAVSSASAGVKVIGTLPNGDKIVRIKTFGLFCPATTTILQVKANGDVETRNAAGGPGVLPAVANAGGLVGAATMLRPARSNTNVEQSGGGAEANSGSISGASSHSTSTSVSGASTTVNSTTTNGGSHNHHNN